jgi:hypothetical protein
MTDSVSRRLLMGGRRLCDWEVVRAGGADTAHFGEERIADELLQTSNQAPVVDCGGTAARVMRLLSWRRRQPAEMNVWVLPHDVAVGDL